MGHLYDAVWNGVNGAFLDQNKTTSLCWPFAHKTILHLLAGENRKIKLDMSTIK